MIAPVAFEPLVATEPDQPPEVEQAVALVAAQVNVELSPFATPAGLALSEMLGKAAETETIADCDAEPPAPVQVSVNCVVAVSAAVALEPLVASLPDQPPEAMQLCAFFALQFRVTE